MTKTHWKKHIDSRYISGEDLNDEYNGLKKEMPVKLVKFDDGETFDPNTQKKEVRTILYFSDLNGKALCKPVVLNKTNANTFKLVSGSSYIEDWIGVPITMYAKADKRHGFVVRFKRFEKPVLKKGSPEWDAVIGYMKTDGADVTKVTGKYNVSGELLKELKDAGSRTEK